MKQVVPEHHSCTTAAALFWFWTLAGASCVLGNIYFTFGSTTFSGVVDTTLDVFLTCLFPAGMARLYDVGFVHVNPGEGELPSPKS